jgi:hypothetical protein
LEIEIESILFIDTVISIFQEVMMKKILLILLMVALFFFVIVGQAKKLACFPELIQPFSVLIEQDRLFIADGPVIYIHSMKDFSLLKKFGKAGEGPGEFKVFPAINRGSVVLSLKQKKLMVTSMGRISFFDLEGEFLEQKNIQSLFGFGILKPLNDRYVGLGVAGDANEQYFTLNFYDPDFKKGKELMRIIAFLGGKTINPITIGTLPPLSARNNRIFFLDYQGIVYIFDQDGEKLQEIEISDIDKNYSPVKITEERKNNYIQYFLSDPRFKPQFERDRNIIKFPDVFPEIRDIRVDGNQIYAVTFRENRNQKEMVVLNQKGQLIKKIMIPLGEYNPRELYPYTVKEGRFFQLFENPDTEKWELHLINLGNG